MTFFSTFISGLHEPVVNILQEEVKQVCVNFVYDGAIVYTVADGKTMSAPPCFNNSFLVIEWERTGVNKPLEWLAKKVLATGGFSSLLNFGPQGKTFRIVTSFENQLASMDSNIKEKLEKMISRATHMKVDRAKADIEYWLLYRSEGAAFFLKRLTRHMAYDKLLSRGELHPELSYIMNWLSGPNREDIFLDSFSGSGSIAFQRLLYFPASKILAFDSDEKKVLVTKEKLSGCQKAGKILTKKLEVEKLLSVCEEASVDKIVTDPPWGFYEDLGMEISDFYLNMLSVYTQILKKDGVIILLTARKEEFKKALSKINSLTLVQEFGILVSGKKASVYKIIFS